jgi:hypothetical protein
MDMPPALAQIPYDLLDVNEARLAPMWNIEREITKSARASAWCTLSCSLHRVGARFLDVHGLNAL